MPQRKRTRVVTGGPQGSDAEVTVLFPTMEQLQTGLDSLIVSNDDADEVDEAVTDLSVVQRQELRAREFFAQHIRAWNWVGDDGDPLPQPGDHPEVFLLLTSEELGYLGKLLRGQAPEQVARRKK